MDSKCFDEEKHTTLAMVKFALGRCLFKTFWMESPVSVLCFFPFLPQTERKNGECWMLDFGVKKKKMMLVKEQLFI